MPFATLKMSLPLEVSVFEVEVLLIALEVELVEVILGLEAGVFLIRESEKEAFSLLMVLEEAGVFLLLVVVEVLLLPATWRGGRGFSHGSRNW